MFLKSFLGNLTGVVGVGGVIYDLEGKQESTYAWGLGIATNNQAKAYALLQGLSIIISLGIRELVVLGDSRMVIKSLNRQEPLKDLRLASILYKIEKIT
jgi:ribonuclease HI